MQNRKFSRKRSGLAMLELVASLPVWLLMMALMINFGYAAMWKIRGLGAARDSLWRGRFVWSAQNDPAPSNWPSPQTMRFESAQDLAAIQPWVDSPDIMHPMTQGPVITDPMQNGYIAVRDRRLDIHGGVHRGTSGLNREFPFIPSLSNLVYNLEQELLDSRWQFHSMGYGSNYSRRAHGWYNFETSPEWDQLQNLFREADQIMLSNPQQERLVPIDRDPEFIAWTGDAPDFYPRIRGCELDPAIVEQMVKGRGGLVEEIIGPRGGGRGGVPERMASAFISLYRDRIAFLRNQRPPPLAEISDLETKVRQLEALLGSLN